MELAGGHWLLETYPDEVSDAVLNHLNAWG